MKRYKKAWLYAALCLTMGLASGCESNIDLEPQGIITAEGYFKSQDDFEKALSGLYDRFHYDNYPFWMDGVTDNGLINQSWNWGYDLSLGNGSPTSSFSTDKWTRSYICIQRANNVINNIDRFQWPGGATDTNRNRGTLYQDLLTQSPSNVCHRSENVDVVARHDIHSPEGGILHSITGKECLEVYSIHHQAVNRVADGFKATAFSVDGIVEVIESVSGDIWGVQFHPELSVAEGNKDMLQIFRYFINQTRIKR